MRQLDGVHFTVSRMKLEWFLHSPCQASGLYDWDTLGPAEFAFPTFSLRHQVGRASYTSPVVSKDSGNRHAVTSMKGPPTRLAIGFEPDGR